MANDAVNLIKQDHRQVEQRLQQLTSATGDVAEVFDEVAAMLIAHGRAEEATIYADTRTAVPQEGEEVEQAISDHRQVEQLIGRMRQAGPGSNEFQDLADQLAQEIQRHVQEEENDVLPALQRAVGPDQLQQLGRRFQQSRDQELQTAKASQR